MAFINDANIAHEADPELTPNSPGCVTIQHVCECVWGRTWVSARGGRLPLEGGSVAAVGAQGWRARSEADGS